MSDAQAETLERALREASELADDDRVTAIEQLGGGWSRHSFVAKVATASGGDRQYIVRAKPQGALLDTDLILEHEVFTALHDLDVPTPRVYFLDPSDETAFGGPFIVMQHLEGIAPNIFRRDDRAWLEEDWNGERGIANDMVENLAKIHSLPSEGLTDHVPELGFLDVVARWRAVYEEQRLIRDPVLEQAYEWLVDREPPDVQHGLVHGDYRVGNTLVVDGHVNAILDWELAYRGDVRFDLGYLALERAAGKHLKAKSRLLGSFAEEDWFLSRYGELTGKPVDREVVRTFEMLGIVMLLATQMTAVWMYRNGLTTDMRMAWSRFSFPGLRQDMTVLMGW